MPTMPKMRPRDLETQPTTEEFIEMMVRSLERIADGVVNIVETLDAVVVESDSGVKYLRTGPE